ncbi:MAG TPA: HAMP domain-containing sensor histidine kinase [Anaeromyxobacteraceae bacterium]|nr:HAMP domain-containing sensor histidine kinase [Anaeromyxobacteraceae bacterium]
MSGPSEPSPERVLILAPTGRDADMLRERIVGDGLPCEACRDLDAILAGLGSGAGAAVVAQEALSSGAAEALSSALGAQEAWSDLPVLLLTLPFSRRAPRSHPAVGILERANVTLLQRPFPVRLFLSAVRSAVRARRRQYQMRDLYRELSRAVQLGDLFVGILGHDLRTPLSAIRMSAELMVRTTEDPRALRQAGRMLSSTDRMTRMIEQLLDFARVRQARGIPLQVATADLGEIARQVLHELADGNPQVRFDVSRRGDLAGSWDHDRLGQVVSNVVGNACQHGAAGSPISVELDGTRPATVRLAVSNLGGIPAALMPALFEPFKRALPARAGEKGLGLGLFIAREIVRAHGGELSARVVGETTVFEATLPREARAVEAEVVSAP